MSRFAKFAFTILLTVSFSACGLGGSSMDDSSGDSMQSAASIDPSLPTTAEPAYTASYRIDYSSVTMPAVGKTTFNLAISSRAARAGSGIQAMSGLSVSVRPWMYMSTMQHGAVVDSVTDNGDGTYTCVVYYLMSSMMNGNPMGDWELGVTVNGETAAFAVDVMMAMGDTARVTMKNDEDMIAGMSGAAETRTYFIFKDSLMGSDGNHMFSVLVANRQSMMMHPPVSNGSTFSNENGDSWSVDTMTLQASTDMANWVDMVDNGSGHWSVSGLSGLMDGMAGSVYVRMNINGRAYTTDGSAAAADYQTFTVTPGGSMSM